MKAKPYPSISKFSLLALLILVFSCKVEVMEQNSVNVRSYPLNSNLAAVYASVLDHNNEYLYVIISYSNTLYSNNIIDGFYVKKIRVSDLLVIDSLFIPNREVIGSSPLAYIGNGELAISTVIRSIKKYELLKISSDLEIETATAITEMVMVTSRLLVCRMNDQELLTVRNIGTNSSGSTQLKVLSNDFEVKTSTVDNTYDASKLYSGSDLIKTSDNRYLYLCNETPAGESRSSILLELRDKNLELVWRKKFESEFSYVPSRLNEFNGKYFVYCLKALEGGLKKLTVLIYNSDGVLLEEKQIGDENLAFKSKEQMVQTDDGGFLVPAVSPTDGSSLVSKIVLHKTDAELNVVNKTYFGGNISVIGGDLHKINTNKYLLVYTDNGYTLDKGNYRLVLQYVDENGNEIE